jgi:hypothetical protein
LATFSRFTADREESILAGEPQTRHRGPAPYYTDNSMHNLKTGRFYSKSDLVAFLRAL